MLKIVHLPSSLFKQRNLVTANPSLKPARVAVSRLHLVGDLVCECQDSS